MFILYFGFLINIFSSKFNASGGTFFSYFIAKSILASLFCLTTYLYVLPGKAGLPDNKI